MPSAPLSPVPSHLSALVLDRLALGALASDERERALAHLADCQRCRAEQATLRELQGEFTAAVLPRTLGAIRRRADQLAPVESGWTRLRRRLLWVLGPALVATAVLLLVPGRPPAPSGPDARDDLRIKGGGLSSPPGARRPGPPPALEVYARPGGGETVARATPGACLSPRDRLRFVARPAGATHLLLLSLDGRGEVTVYYPFGGTGSSRLPEGPQVELPGSIELDEAPGPERLFALFGETPLGLPAVRPALAALFARGPAAVRGDAASDARLVEAAAGARVVSFVFEKTSGPDGCRATP